MGVCFVFYHDRVERDRQEWVNRVFPECCPFEIARIDQLLSWPNGPQFDVLIVGCNDAPRVTKMLRDYAHVARSKPKVLIVKGIAPTERAMALMAGFDDVFDYTRMQPEEAVARLRALRRRYLIHAEVLAREDLQAASLALVANVQALTRSETKVLAALMRRRGRTVSYFALRVEIGGVGEIGSFNYLTVVVCHLRRKLREGVLIENEPRAGYKIVLKPPLDHMMPS